MNTKFTLKNFRVFDEKQGGTFDLKPITILTGCNSSGKSSLVKSILLLKNFFCQLDESGRFSDCKLDFGNTAVKLSKYDAVRNSHSRKGSKMTFAYDADLSNILNGNVQVELKFKSDDKDVLNRGWLDSVSVKKEDETVIFAATVAKDKKTTNIFTQNKGDYDIKERNLCCIKNDFLVYALVQLANDELYHPEENEGDNIDFADERWNRWIVSLSKYISADEIQSLKDELLHQKNSNDFRLYRNLHKRCVFSANAPLFIEAAKLGTLFPMPIFEVLYGVKKCDVRKILHNIIDSSNSISVENIRIKRALDKMLNGFEQSEYQTLLDYFVAKEYAWLKSVGLQKDINWDGDYVSYLEDFLKEPGLFSMFEMPYIMEIEEFVEYYNPDVFANLFGLLYRVDRLNNEVQGVEGYEYIQRIESINKKEYVHRIFAQFRDYFASVMESALCTISFRDFEYVADSYTVPKRIYTAEQNDAFGKFLFEYLEVTRAYEPISKTDIKAGDFINKWIQKLQLGDHISISSTAEGLGVIVKIHKSPEDKHGRLLADEGFGITKIIGLLIYIEWAILKTYGRFGYTIAIEEPENHLHPKYQSMLAKIFAEAYEKYKIHFIVETHSEYLIRRSQVFVAANRDKKNWDNPFTVYYLPKDGVPYAMEYRHDGKFSNEFGPGFFDEAANLAFKLF
jgi:AAA15 family ATPase/GTPase